MLISLFYFPEQNMFRAAAGSRSSTNSSEQEGTNEELAGQQEDAVEQNSAQDRESPVQNSLSSASDHERADAGSDDEGREDIQTEGAQGNHQEDLSFESDDSQDSNYGEDEDCRFEGSPVSFAEYMLAILTFTMRFSLSGQCLNELFKLIALMCPPENKCVKTLYKLKKYSAMIGSKSVVFHYFCSVCEGADGVCEHCEGPTKVSHFWSFQ